jgi:hypothetical protein
MGVAGGLAFQQHHCAAFDIFHNRSRRGDIADPLDQ